MSRLFSLVLLLGLSLPVVAQTKTPVPVQLCNAARDSSCQLTHAGHGTSGTVFAKRFATTPGADATGLIITCAHIFEPTAWETLKQQKVKAVFRGEPRPSICKPIAIDWDHDLLVLAAPIHPDTPTSPLAETSMRQGEKAYVCGYGPDGRYLCNIAPVRGYTTVSWFGGSRKSTPAKPGDFYKSAGVNQLVIEYAAARSGDSGGGIFNAQGKLTGVLWGTGPNDNGNMETCGTDVSTVRRFLKGYLPRNYQWGCQPQYQCCPPVYPSYQQQQPSQPSLPPATSPPVDHHPVPVPDSTPLPTPSPEPTPTPADDPHDKIEAWQQQILEEIAELRGQLIPPPVVEPPPPPPPKQPTVIDDILSRLDELRADHETLAGTLVQLKSGQSAQQSALQALQQQLSQVTTDESEITIHVNSGRYISPAYVDVSALWALQQATGVDHLVLITDTKAAHWTSRMEGEYEAAKEVFPAIDLYDIHGTGVSFKELPQLVIYSTSPDAAPTIVKGTDLVSKELQKITRGED